MEQVHRHESRSAADPAAMPLDLAATLPEPDREPPHAWRPLALPPERSPWVVYRPPEPAPDAAFFAVVAIFLGLIALGALGKALVMLLTWMF
jgi:hypothetical protein